MTVLATRCAVRVVTQWKLIWIRPRFATRRPLGSEASRSFASDRLTEPLVSSFSALGMSTIFNGPLMPCEISMYTLLRCLNRSSQSSALACVIDASLDEALVVTLGRADLREGPTDYRDVADGLFPTEDKSTHGSPLGAH